MENYFENSAEETEKTKDTWVAPELKKIDVEEITASGAELGVPDGTGTWSS